MCRDCASGLGSRFRVTLNGKSPVAKPPPASADLETPYSVLLLCSAAKALKLRYHQKGCIVNNGFPYYVNFKKFVN